MKKLLIILFLIPFALWGQVPGIGGMMFAHSQEDAADIWSVTDLQLVQSYDLNDNSNWMCISFSADGTKLFAGTFADRIYEWNLSAWDISTISYSQYAVVSTEQYDPEGMFISNDGTKLFTVGTYSNDELNKYTLSTPYDINKSTSMSATQFLDISSLGNNTKGVYFKPDGTKAYFCDGAADYVYEYSLSSAWDISTMSLSYSWDLTPASGNISSAVEDIYISDNGYNLVIVDNLAKKIMFFNLLTAWDLSTIDESSIVTITNPGSIGGCVSVYVNPEGTKLYTTERVNNDIHEFNIVR